MTHFFTFLETPSGFFLIMGIFLILILIIFLIYRHITYGLTLNDIRINRVLNHNINGGNPPMKIKCGWKSVEITPLPNPHRDPDSNQKTSSS